MGLAEISVSTVPRHLKVTGHTPALGYEPCEDVGCAVPGDGVASSCGRIACPACGCSGTNLAATAGTQVLAPADEQVLTKGALEFVELLQRELGPTRRELLERRHAREG